MNQKRIGMMLILLLSMSMLTSAFAQETTQDISVEPTAYIVEAAPVAPEVMPEPQTEAVAEPEPATEAPAAVTQAPAAATEAPAATAQAPAPATDASATAQPETATQTPGATEASTPTPAGTPDATQAPDPTPSAVEQTAAPVQRSVSIQMDMPSHLSLGDTVTLYATLYGYDGLNLAFQWQYTYDGKQWFDAQGANSTDYTFAVSAQTTGTGWRLAVTVL